MAQHEVSNTIFFYRSVLLFLLLCLHAAIAVYFAVILSWNQVNIEIGRCLFSVVCSTVCPKFLLNSTKINYYFHFFSFLFFTIRNYKLNRFLELITRITKKKNRNAINFNYTYINMQFPFNCIKFCVLNCLELFSNHEVKQMMMINNVHMNIPFFVGIYSFLAEISKRNFLQMRWPT